MQGRLIDGRYHGTAIGCYLEGGASGPKENARLVLETDGSVSVYVGSSSVGQGVETVCAQIAADALEMPMHDIRGGASRLDRSRDRGLRLLQLALDRHGRQRAGHGGGASCATTSAMPRPRDGAARPRTSSIDAGKALAPDGRSLPLGAFAGHLGGRAPMPATSAPTATAPMPPMSRSIPRPGRSSCSITSRSRMSAASSTR